MVIVSGKHSLVLHCIILLIWTYPFKIAKAMVSLDILKQHSLIQQMFIEYLVHQTLFKMHQQRTSYIWR